MGPLVSVTSQTESTRTDSSPFLRQSRYCPGGSADRFGPSRVYLVGAARVGIHLFHIKHTRQNRLSVFVDDILRALTDFGIEKTAAVQQVFVNSKPSIVEMSRNVSMNDSISSGRTTSLRTTQPCSTKCACCAVSKKNASFGSGTGWDPAFRAFYGISF